MFLYSGSLPTCNDLVYKTPPAQKQGFARFARVTALSLTVTVTVVAAMAFDSQTLQAKPVGHDPPQVASAAEPDLASSIVPENQDDQLLAALFPQSREDAWSSGMAALEASGEDSEAVLRDAITHFAKWEGRGHEDPLPADPFSDED